MISDFDTRSVSPPLDGHPQVMGECADCIPRGDHRHVFVSMGAPTTATVYDTSGLRVGTIWVQVDTSGGEIDTFVAAWVYMGENDDDEGVWLPWASGTGGSVAGEDVTLDDTSFVFLTSVTNVQTAIETIDGWLETLVADVTDHIAEPSAHAASAIDFTPNGSIAATNVQDAIQEVRDEATGTGHTEDHASRHGTAGADPVKLDDLDEPDDNTDLDATTSAHGLLPKLTGEDDRYLDGTGVFSQPLFTPDVLAVRVTRTAALNATTTPTSVIWDNVVDDDGGFWAASPDPEKIIVPTGCAGWYVITFAGRHGNANNDWLQGDILLNGTAIAGDLDFNATNSTPKLIGGSVAVKLADADEIELSLTAQATQAMTVGDSFSLSVVSAGVASGA